VIFYGPSAFLLAKYLRKIEIFGVTGDYRDSDQLSDIIPNSFIAEAINKGDLMVRSVVSKSKPELETDLMVMPLANDKALTGVICATEFFGGSVSPFIECRLELVKNECEPLFNLLLAERKLRAKDTLIYLMRNRVHPLQIKSEEYFLKNFDISPEQTGHPFIFADLVDSVSLNEHYKDKGLVQKTIDDHLNLVWEKFKHLGIVLSRTKGDLISIVVPNQKIDSTNSATERCLEIMQFLAECSPSFRRSQEHMVLRGLCIIVLLCQGSQLD